MAIAVGLAFQLRGRRRTARPELGEQKSTSSFGHPGSQSSLTVNDAGMVHNDIPPVPNIPSMYFRNGEPGASQPMERRQMLVQPHFEQQALHIRRMSALPQDDTRQRVNSVASTLTAVPSSDALGGSNISVPAAVTNPKTPKPIGVVDSNRRFSSVASRRNGQPVEEAQEELVLSPTHGIKVQVQSHPSSPYSPRDKRFSIHLSLNLPDHPPSESSPSYHPPDGSMAPGTARSDAQPASDEKRLILQMPNPAPTPHSAKGPGGLADPSATPSSARYFGDWTGFDKPAAAENATRPGNEPSLAVTTSPYQAQPPLKERRSMSSGRITYLADVVEENERRKSLEAEAHAAVARFHITQARGGLDAAGQQHASIVPPKIAIPEAVVRPTK